MITSARIATTRGARAISLRVAVSLAAIVSACGGGEAPSLPEEVAPPPAIERPPPPGQPDPLYDEEGQLLESDTRVAGLVLPRGLETVVDEERRHVYRTDVPIAKVQQYLGVRLVTGQVDSRPNGSVTYVDALPRGVRGGEVRLDVTIDPVVGSGTRVEVRERLPAPVDPPSEEEALRTLQEQMRHAE